MANPLRDMSVIMQGLVAAAIAVVLVLVGIYLPFSPVAQEKDQVDKAVQQRAQLTQEVRQLQVYRRRFGELKQEMDALNKQLDTLNVVPEETMSSFVSCRRGGRFKRRDSATKGETVVPKDNNYPRCRSRFRQTAVFNVLDFFGRLSRLSRIINVGDLEFADPKGEGRTLHCVGKHGERCLYGDNVFWPGDQRDTAAAKPGQIERE
jgi:cell division protein FtsB